MGARQPEQDDEHREVPQRLVQERRVERLDVGVPVRAMPGVDLERPGQIARSAEQLLVEPVAPATDRLRENQAGRDDIEGREDAETGSTGTDRGAQRTADDDAGHAEPALLQLRDRGKVVAEAMPVGGDVVEPGADDAGRDAPGADRERSVRGESAALEFALRQTAGEEDADRDQGAVPAHEEGPDLDENRIARTGQRQQGKHRPEGSDTLRAVRRTTATLLTGAALLVAAPAAIAGPGLARVVSPDGKVLVTAPAQAGFAYPADGSMAQVADVVAGAGGLRLRGVSLLGGRIRIDRAVVAGSRSSVGGVTVDGVLQPDGANRVAAVPGAGWALILQRASLPLAGGGRRETTVAVRLHLTEPVGGLAAGSEILIGYDAGTATAPGVNLTGAAREIPAELVPIYRSAARTHGVPWSVLAAINRVETSFGRNLNVSSAGAVGWMQFMPGTWRAYGVDANRDGKADPYDPQDAIHAAARYLAANRAATNLRQAVWHYNHSWRYVDLVLGIAEGYASASPTLPVDRAGAGADEARGGVFSPVLLW